MQQKAKPCNGIGKAKGFKGCEKVTPFRKFGLCDSCRRDWLLNTELGNIELEKATLKAQKPRLKAEKEYKVAVTESKSLKSLKSVKNSCKKIVHEYVRLRDKYKPCVSCGKPWNSSFQAGHCYKAETYETLKYHLHNINGQCMQCNLYNDGNVDAYLLKLPKRIGEEHFQNLKYLAGIDKQFTKVWDVQKLKTIINQVRFLMKDLKK